MAGGDGRPDTRILLGGRVGAGDITGSSSGRESRFFPRAAPGSGSPEGSTTVRREPSGATEGGSDRLGRANRPGSIGPAPPGSTYGMRSGAPQPMSRRPSEPTAMTASAVSETVARTA
jgi:hypothetical protein